MKIMIKVIEITMYCTLYNCTLWRVETLSPSVTWAPQHFLNQLIFLNVVIQISVAQTSVRWLWAPGGGRGGRNLSGDKRFQAVWNAQNLKPRTGSLFLLFENKKCKIWLLFTKKNFNKIVNLKHFVRYTWFLKIIILEPILKYTWSKFWKSYIPQPSG